MLNKYQLLVSSRDKCHKVVQAQQRTLAGQLLFGAVYVDAFLHHVFNVIIVIIIIIRTFNSLVWYYSHLLMGKLRLREFG